MDNAFIHTAIYVGMSFTEMGWYKFHMDYTATDIVKLDFIASGKAANLFGFQQILTHHQPTVWISTE